MADHLRQWRSAKMETTAFLKDPDEYKRVNTKPKVNPYQIIFPLRGFSFDYTLRILTTYSQISQTVQFPQKSRTRLAVIIRSLSRWISVHQKELSILAHAGFNGVAPLRAFIGSIVSKHGGTEEYNPSHYQKEWHILAAAFNCSLLSREWHTTQLAWSMVLGNPFWRGHPPAIVREQVLRTLILPHVLSRNLEVDTQSGHGKDIRSHYDSDTSFYSGVSRVKHSSHRAIKVRQKINGKRLKRQSVIKDYFQRCSR